jgi:predicted nuclease with TOPRIM domain
MASKNPTSDSHGENEELKAENDLLREEIKSLRIALKMLGDQADQMDFTDAQHRLQDAIQELSEVENMQEIGVRGE